jgi:hypothetical protein
MSQSGRKHLPKLERKSTAEQKTKLVTTSSVEVSRYFEKNARTIGQYNITIPLFDWDQFHRWQRTHIKTSTHFTATLLETHQFSA